MTRWRTSSDDVEGRPDADLPDTAAGRVAAVARVLPGVVGAALVCWGLGMIWLPLAVVAAGVFLLRLDWRL